MTWKSQPSIAWLRRRIELRTISQREQARRLKTCCCCSRLGKHNCSVVDTGLKEFCPKNLYKASTWETYSAQYLWAHCIWMDVVSLLILLAESVEVVDYALLSISERWQIVFLYYIEDWPMYFYARESASGPLLWHPNICLGASPPVLSMWPAH
jgi:hypothetical protein